MKINFEWDINKNISNQQKHGITFEEAQSKEERQTMLWKMSDEDLEMLKTET